MGGGGMVKEVYYDYFIPDDPPTKFEAGTPNIAGVVAFKKAVEYLEEVGIRNIEKNDKELVKYTIEKLNKIKNIKIYGPKDINLRSSIISFNCYTNEGQLIHPHDLATILDERGIVIRAGHHCAQPLMEKLKVSSTARISFYIYNTKQDIDRAEKAIQKTLWIFIQKSS